MKEQVLEFKKSDHFLYSQWSRKISDQLLRNVLSSVEVQSKNKKTIIVFPSYLKKLKSEPRETDCLILIFKEKILVTGYWCDRPNYLFSLKEQTSYHLIY